MRGNHAACRQRDAERLGVGGRHGDDLPAGDETPVHILVRTEVVPLVFLDRTANRRGHVVRFRIGLSCRGRQEEGTRRHRVPLEPEARGAPYVVGAGLGDRVVDHAGRLAELGRESVGDDLHLPDQDLGDRQHPQAGAILLGIGVAVDLVVGVHLRSVRIDARDAELVVLVARDVRLQEREVVRIAGHERQVPDLVLSNRPAEIDFPRLGDRRLARDGHGFRYVPDTERQIDDSRLPGRDGQSLLFEFLEALELGSQAITPQRQQRSAVGTRFVRDDDAGVAGVEVGDRDADTRKCRSRLVADGAFNRPVDRLRLREPARGPGQDQHQYQHCPKHAKHRTTS